MFRANLGSSGTFFLFPFDRTRLTKPLRTVPRRVRYSRSSRSGRLREINPVNRHRNSIKRRRLTRQFPRAQCLHRGASQHARIALPLRRQTKRQLQRCSNFEQNLRVKQNPSPRNIPQLPRMELRRLVLERANLQRHVNVVAHRFPVLLHGSPVNPTARRWPTAAPISADNKAVTSHTILPSSNSRSEPVPLQEAVLASCAATSSASLSWISAVLLLHSKFR